MNRRNLLKGLGGAALCAPWVTSLLANSARATAGNAPLRFFVLFTGNGMHPDQWLPTGSETSWSPSPVLAPMDDLRAKLCLLRGFSDPSGHSVGMSGCLTGRPSTNGDGIATGGPSIDQFFADHWHGRTPLHSLETGVYPANAASDQITYSASGLPIPPIGQSLGAFDRVFAVTNEDPEIALRRRAQKASVLDGISRELTSLQGRLPTESRRLLDEHLTLIREQEQDLQAPFEPTFCELHEPPTTDGLLETWDNHNQTIAAAFRCDATRVASMRIGGWGGIESGGYPEIGIDAAHHDAAHGGSPDPYNDTLRINEFHAEQFASLMRTLDAIPEGNGTLLDNTVCLWVNEFGLGDFNHHSRADIHIVLGGGANAGMAQGVFREVNGPYGDFLFSLTHLLGHPETTSFGDNGTSLVSALFS